ncbi:hypothetical protein [Vibrio astriarenae]|uniref:hypothetical protein n=1 Tax=Vibrio astriarenae TaxID=1481923 RepID=UPI003735B2B9
MAYGLNVYGADGDLYFSTQFSALAYHSMIQDNVTSGNGSITIDVPAGREIATLAITHDTAQSSETNLRLSGMEAGSTNTNQSIVEYWIEGNTVFWEYIDRNEPWDREFDFTILIMLEGV